MSTEEVGGRARSPRSLAVPAFAVARPRLEQQLDHLRPGGLGVVVASAGSGKSVLLAQWEAVAPEVHRCHLQLRAVDADAVVCARHLVAAVREEVPTFPEGVDTMVVAGGASLGPAFVEAFVDGLTTIGAGLVLLLDDLHLVESPAVVEDLGRIVTGLPSNVRAVVASRWDPGFSVRRMRLEGRLLEIRGVDLAFDVEEGRSLVAQVAGQAVSDDQGAALVARTDGWAAGLQLVGVALKGVPDLTGAIDALAGDDRLVAEYLTAEVLDQQDPEMRRFLLRTAVLEWLSEDICDAITGDGNARRMLDEVVARSLFLVPLDRGGHRYRYHHLFADLLRLRLRSADPTAATGLHRRAAAWLLENDHLAEAVDHLLAAGDRDDALRLIVRDGHLLYERGESATLARWMQGLARHPEATALVDLNLLAAHVGSDASTAGAEVYRQVCRRTDLTPEERATADGYFAALVQCDLPLDEVERASGAVLAALPRLDPDAMPEVLGLGGIEAVEALALFASAQGALLQGDAGAGDRIAALLSHPALRYPLWRANVLGWLSVARAWTGHITEAGRHAEAARAGAQAAGVPNHVAVAPSHVASASSALEQGDHLTAAAHLHEAEQCARRSGRARLHDLMRLVRARHVASTEGPWAGLDSLRRPSSTVVGANVFTVAADAVEARLLVQVDRLVQAETVLRRAGSDRAVTAARLDLLLARGDIAGSRRVLDAWDPAPDDLRSHIQRGIRAAVVLEAEGQTAAAASTMLDAVARAEPEGLRRPFRQVPAALRLLRTLPRGGPHSFVASVLEVPVSPEAARAAAARLVEPLTEREQSILVHLPSRLGNSEIAAELYISVNTTKTHLRNIYRKLSVTDRDAAVARAIEIGLL